MTAGTCVRPSPSARNASRIASTATRGVMTARSAASWIVFTQLPPSGGRSFRYRRHRVDLDAQAVARQPRDLDCRPGGSMRSKDPCVDIVHERELVHVD